MLAAAGLGNRATEMRRNLGSLMDRNKALGADLESLRSDSDRAEREARSLGYLAVGQYEVVLAGWVDGRSSTLGAGTTLAYQRPSSLGDGEIKALSALATLIAFLLCRFRALALRPKRGREGRRPRSAPARGSTDPVPV